jgi:NADH:ubiquinone oxidoreductase subunit 3 (subunit A)
MPTTISLRIDNVNKMKYLRKKSNKLKQENVHLKDIITNYDQIIESLTITEDVNVNEYEKIIDSLKQETRTYEKDKVNAIIYVLFLLFIVFYILMYLLLSIEILDNESKLLVNLCMFISIIASTYTYWN